MIIGASVLENFITLITGPSPYVTAALLKFGPRVTNIEGRSREKFLEIKWSEVEVY